MKMCSGSALNHKEKKIYFALSFVFVLIDIKVLSYFCHGNTVKYYNTFLGLIPVLLFVVPKIFS